jgi:hypothetical protein
MESECVLPVAGFAGLPFPKGDLTLYNQAIVHRTYRYDGTCMYHHEHYLGDIGSVDIVPSYLFAGYLTLGCMLLIASLVLWNLFLFLGAVGSFLFSRRNLFGIVIRAENGMSTIWTTSDWSAGRRFEQALRRELVRWRVHHCSAGHSVL